MAKVPFTWSAIAVSLLVAGMKFTFRPVMSPHP
jgi:hypothetical protein